MSADQGFYMRHDRQSITCITLPYVQSTTGVQRVILHRLEAEVDELWSFVGKKANRQWVWIAMDAVTHQILAFHVGDRSRQSALALWGKIPTEYQAQAMFYTDCYEAYKGVIPPAQHRAITKLARKTNHVERFNCTLAGGSGSSLTLFPTSSRHVVVLEETQ